MRIFITGGSGFIGSHLIRTRPAHVSKIMAPTRSAAPYKDGDTSVERPIYSGDADALCDLLRDFKPDVVINAAAAGVQPGERGQALLQAINVDLALSLWQAAQTCGAKGFVQLGSMAEYAAPNAQAFLSESDTDGGAVPANAYGLSKLKATQALVDSANACQGPSTLILRLFGVFGPGEAPHRLTSHLVSMLTKGQPVPLSAGTQIRDFVYIKDVVAAIWQASERLLDRPIDVEVINIGSGEGISVKDFVIAFCRAGGFATTDLQFGAQPMRDTDAPYLVANIAKADNHLGWKPRWNGARGLADYFIPQ